MKYKGKGVEGSEVAERSIVLSTDPEDVLLDDVITAEGDEVDDSEEDDDEKDDDEEDDNEEKVFSASSHSDDDDNDDDDNKGGTGVKVTEASNEKNVDDYMHDDANEVSEDADGEGEKVDDQNVDEVEKLILRIEPEVEVGEIRHTYTLDEVLKMFNVNAYEFNFDFEKELNAFDINQQPEYEYKYVEEADVYDRVEVEDCTDEDSANEDTSEFPTLVAEILKDKNFDGTTKDPQKEERKKWLRESNERKFKRPLMFYKRDRDVLLGDIISWGFLPHVNAYAIRREYGVQYFERLYDIISLPWWDVEELSKVRTLGYPIRRNDVPMWGLIKCESLKNFKHWKPHYPRKVRRVNPETGNEEKILHVKKPRVIKNIPMPRMEQEFYKGFSVFLNKILFKAEDREQAMQFQKVVSIFFQKGINADSKWSSKWWQLEEEEKLKREKERKALEDQDYMMRHTLNQRMEAEEKQAVEANEKLRKMLARKPKQREETFKSL
ncbi:hypothetical protein Hanom_Chr04g00327541 [Helianthus anomalus]